MQPSLNISPRHVRSNEISQKRDSYVSAIRSSEMDFDVIGSTNFVRMDEIELITKDRLNSIISNGKEIRTKVNSKSQS